MKFQLAVMAAVAFVASTFAIDRVDAGVLGPTKIGGARIFDTAVVVAGLQPAVAEARTFTLFLPADEALREEGTAELLRGVYLTPSNRQRLFDLVAYHLVPGEKISFDSKVSRRVTTLSGEDLSIASDGNQTTLNGHVGVTRSIDLGNGIVHIVSGLLWAELNQDLAVESGDATHRVSW